MRDAARPYIQGYAEQIAIQLASTQALLNMGMNQTFSIHK
jgi:hypothetical protein